MDFSQWDNERLLAYLELSSEDEFEKPQRITELTLHMAKFRRMVKSEAQRRGLIQSAVPSGDYTLVSCKKCNVIDSGYFVYHNKITGEIDCICRNCGERAIIKDAQS